MTIFQLLHVENIKNSNERFISLKGNGKIELHQKELLINDLLTLWNEPSSVYKPLVKRLVEHSFINTGLFTGLNSYSSYIDPSILQDLGLTENRIKVRPTLKSEFITKDRLDLIIDQLIRNFAKKFTKTYDNDKKLFTLLEDGKTLVVDKDSNDSRKAELNLDLKDSAKIEYIRFKLNKDFTPIYKFDKVASDLSGQVTYRQTTYLGQPGKRLEINPFGEVSTEFPNNKYEKMEIKTKEVKPKNLIPTPTFESEDFADNSESLYEGYNEVKVTDQDVIEETINLTTTQNIQLGPETKINIYAGTGENAELSNFAIRPFTINVETNSGEKAFTFQSVEQGFHFYKTIVANNPIIAKKVLQTTNGAQLKQLTNRANLPMTFEQVKEWDSTSKSIMLNLMYDSYIQNPKVAEKLLSTGNATITHNQDNTRWKKDFPEVTMIVRDMLKEENILPSQEKFVSSQIINPEITKNKPKGLPPINRSTNNCS